MASEAEAQTQVIIESCEFWMIWTKTGHLPRRLHSTYQSAEAECERLAALNPGKKFIILEAVSKRHVPVATALEAAQSEAA